MTGPHAPWWSPGPRAAAAAPGGGRGGGRGGGGAGGGGGGTGGGGTGGGGTGGGAPMCAAVASCASGKVCDLSSQTCVDCGSDARCVAEFGAGKICVGGSCITG